jgi:NADPH:quinone reductase-like Zn-dependent oxidoreductase
MGRPGKPSQREETSGAQGIADAAAVALLIALTVAVFWGVQHNDFVSYDDPVYVTENPMVREGLTGRGVAYAFTGIVASNWQPITVLSHQLDVTLFGVDPRGHHLVNLAFHAVNATLLFWFFRRTTGSIGRSAVVAALFALHPLRVESVAWIAERKDVLSTFFWLLTLIAYARYARKPTGTGYALVTLLFMLGLMAKSMLVTLPLVLLLLDFWPLRRFPGNSARPGERTALALGLVKEKAPLVVMSLVISGAAVYSQRAGAALRSAEAFPLYERVTNAVLSYAMYVVKSFWPANLAVFYPHPKTAIVLWQVGLAVLVLAAVTVAVLRAAHTRPYLAVGWFWYVVTLVPVIGLVQIGSQAMADRYSYVPGIGLAVMLVWGTADAVAGSAMWTRVAAAAAIIVVAALGLQTRAQVRVWRDSETLYRHALRVTNGNYPAHVNLGYILAERGEFAEAARHFESAAEIEPNATEALYNLAGAHYLMGNHGRAAELYRQVLGINPDDPESHAKLALSLMRLGQTRETRTTRPRARCFSNFNAGPRPDEESSMRIWRFHEHGELSNLRLEDAPIPTPKADEALVKIEYAALNPADAFVIRGLYPRSGPPPLCVGRDGAGVIEKAVEGGRFRKGDRVIVLRSEVGVTRDGTLAEFASVPEASLAPLPSGWTAAEGAAGPLVFLTAWVALVDVGGLGPGMTVFINGASGGVGSASVMLAHAMGARVMAASRRADKRARLKELGADLVVDSSNPDRMEEEAKRALGEERVDIVVENLGGPYLQSSVNLIKEGGRIGVVGLLAGYASELMVGNLIFKRARIEGIALGSLTPPRAQDAWAKIVGHLARSGAKPIIDHVFPMENVLEGFAKLAIGPMGKVVIDVAGG